jgi:5-(carboxyamino)imidazole ribonucleotide mutase
MSETQPLVYVVMGSDTDWDDMREACKALEEFSVPYEASVASAHRSPARVEKLSREAAGRGVEVIIAGAGASATLAGVIAAQTTVPVLGVPLATSPLAGVDALLATAQMPAGVPVGTMAVGKAGARNAGLLAVLVLALKRPELAARVAEYKSKLADAVEAKDRALAERIRKEGARG